MPAVTPTSVGAVDTPDVLPVDQATAIAATQSYAQESLDARDLARNWATKTTGEVVAGQGYGAKKYAQDAATAVLDAQGSLDASVARAQDWATKTSGEVVSGQGYGAKKYALDAAASFSDFQTRYVGPFNSTPTYVGGSPPWNVGALYWDRLQTKFFVWNGASWDATDVSAQAAKAAAQDAAATAINIAAGLSASTYTLDGIDAQRAGAICSPAKGLFMLDGARVALSSLLSFSSAAKYTVGPDGNYVLNSANGPAWDWSTGRRRLLIEAIGATNYWVNSEDATYWGGGGQTASVAANALFGTLSLATLTQTLSNNLTYATGGSVSCVNGDIVTQTVAFLAVGGKDFAYMGLSAASSSWGADADATAIVVSGPGAATRYTGALWTISGLSTTVPTVIRLTRTIRTTESVQALVYMTLGSVGNAGDQIKIGRPQLEKGYGSSYIVSGASPTARAADVVTATPALLALLTAANATLAVRGTLLSPDNAVIIGSTNRYGSVYLQNAGANFVIFDPAGGQVIYPYPSGGASKTFGVANSYSSAPVRKASVNGGAVASDAGVVEINGVDTGIGIGNGGLGAAGNLLLDELVVWPILASDAGLQAQARVYS